MPSTAFGRRASARWGLNRAGATEGARRRENRAPSARAAATDAVRPPILIRPREDGGPASGPYRFHGRGRPQRSGNRECRDTRPDAGRRRLTLPIRARWAPTCPGRARGPPKRQPGNGVDIITECRGRIARVPYDGTRHFVAATGSGTPRMRPLNRRPCHRLEAGEDRRESPAGRGGLRGVVSRNIARVGGERRTRGPLPRRPGQCQSLSRRHRESRRLAAGLGDARWRGGGTGGARRTRLTHRPRTSDPRPVPEMPRPPVGRRGRGRGRGQDRTRCSHKWCHSCTTAAARRSDVG